MGAELELFAAGIRLQELKTINLEMPEHAGFIIAGYKPDGRIVAAAYVRAGLSQEWRDSFAQGVLERFQRLSKHGPILDGWHKRSDGLWQLWFRPVQFNAQPTDR